MRVMMKFMMNMQRKIAGCDIYYAIQKTKIVIGCIANKAFYKFYFPIIKNLENTYIKIM